MPVDVADSGPAILCSAFGAIQLGSKTAFTDLVGSFIILTTVSYGLAILPHILTRRKNVPRGPFWMGSAGYLVNGVAVLLIIIFNIFFCFRMNHSVTPGVARLLTNAPQLMYILPLSVP